MFNELNNLSSFFANLLISLLLSTKITSITSKRKKIKIEYDQSYEIFDKIIMATHPD